MGKGIYIFDYDGTLFDTLTADAYAFDKTLKYFSLPPISVSRMTELIGYTIEDIAAKCLDTTKETIITEFSSIFTDYEVEAVFETGKLYEHIPELLEKLYKMDFLMEICSYGNGQYLGANIKKFNLNKYFHHINTADSNSTKAQVIGEIFRKHDADFGVMIGDRHIDIDSGKANNFITIGVTYGFGENEVQSADYIANSPLELESVLLAINKENS
jgi:phosphoglycolate phosphatase